MDTLEVDLRPSDDDRSGTIYMIYHLWSLFHLWYQRHFDFLPHCSWVGDLADGQVVECMMACEAFVHVDGAYDLNNYFYGWDSPISIESGLVTYES